jgi:aquaporin Z
VKYARILMAELIGTFILMMGGPGTAVLATGGFNENLNVGVLGVSLAFGLSLLVIAYAIGPISGGHVNPAVTLAMAIMRKIEMALVPVYVIGQVIGCLLGGLAIWTIANGGDSAFDAAPANFATNLWGSDNGFFSFGAMVAAEIIFTALLCFTVLSTTSKKFSPGMGGLAVGMVLALIHLISIPIDNTSVNPVRSLGMAIFAGGDAMTQLWAFIVFPLIGAVVGCLAWLAVDDAGIEDTALGNRMMIDMRDQASRVAGKVDETAARAGERMR